MVELTMKEIRDDQRFDDLVEVDGIIEKHYDKDDDPYDITDCVYHEIETNVNYRHLRSFNFNEIHGNVVAYMETMEEMKEEEKKKKAV
jgi:hypothetical protein|tara:strand:- start:78 stop:341 length:264 start_codon:yes stop_codon:yes gene_type:complete